MTHATATATATDSTAPRGPGIGRLAGLALAAALGAALAVPAAAAGESGAALAEHPLAVRNLSPATLLFGLPRALGAAERPGGTSAALIVEHANNFTSGTGDDARVVFDGSTTAASLALRGALSARVEWGVEVPYVHHSGGFTDGFIDGFHDLFGFPDGGRSAAPRGRLDYRIDYAGEPSIVIGGSGGDLGDVRGWLGWRIADGDRQVVARAMVKAPTGSVDELSGSGGTDVSLWLELVDRRTLSGAGIVATLMGGATALGDGDLARADQRDVVYVGHFGLHWPVTDRLILRGQIDAHSEVIDSDVRQLAHGAVQGTLGGTLALSQRAWLDLGVVEDLTGGSAPDVVFLLTLGVRL